jgi:hypothetical protein
LKLEAAETEPNHSHEPGTEFESETAMKSLRFPRGADPTRGGDGVWLAAGFGSQLKKSNQEEVP